MEEKNGRGKSRLANYIGKAKELWMNKLEGSLNAKKLFLLGSDGLFKRLKDEDVTEIAGSMKSDRHVQRACKHLAGLVLIIPPRVFRGFTR